MQMVKIRIPDQAGRAKALVEMARRGRLICLAGETFVVPELALELLQSLGVSYQELGWLPDDELTREWLKEVQTYRAECDAADRARLDPAPPEEPAS